MPLPDTSVRTTSRMLPPCVREATTKSPEKDCPPAGRSAISRCQPAGSLGSLLWTRIRSRRSKSMVPPRRHGTPTRLRNCAISSPDRPTAATTRTVPGVIRSRPWSYGPSSDASTIRAAAEVPYRASRLAGRSSSPPAMTGRTSAVGAIQSGRQMVPQAMAGMAIRRATRAIQSEPSPRK